METSMSTFSQYINSDTVKNMMIKTLGDKSAVARLTASLISAVNNNPKLAQCPYKEILYAAFYGESLGLYPLQQLGHYFIVPYFDIKTKSLRAVFQIGYKGMIQLAIKTNQYTFINCTPIKEGELKKWDGITEQIEVSFLEDPDARGGLTTIGFVGSFKLINGFQKTVYWTKKQIIDHASKFSPGFNSSKNVFWKDNFDAMGRKCVLRALLINWGVLSAPMSVLMADFEGKKIVTEEDVSPIEIEASKEEVTDVKEEER